MRIYPRFLRPIGRTCGLLARKAASVLCPATAAMLSSRKLEARRPMRRRERGSSALSCFSAAGRMSPAL
eukprot:1178395-Prorocentrum_minimum.AAC.1